MASPMTILIPTYGRPTLLGRTLASLGVCRLPKSYTEAIVIENGSRAGAEAVVAEVAEVHPHLKLRYLHVERANKSHALNEALATVGDGLVVFFDDDVRLDPGVLEAYSEAAEHNSEHAFFGGPFGCDYEEAPPGWLLPLLPSSAKGVRFDGRERPDYYLGFNWAAYGHELLSIGGFNPDFGPGSPTGARGQESEMQRRLRQAGARPVDVAKACVWHYVPTERCTPEWAVSRMYRSGLGSGARARQGKGARLLRQAVGTILTESPRYAVAVIRGQYPQAVLSKGALALWLGYLRAYWDPSSKSNT